jgi:hypothetical protein
MASTLRLQLADGTEVEGLVEGPIAPRAYDLLASAGSTHLRLTAEKDERKADDDDVEGHGMRTSVQIRIADDVEGHAFTLRLPNAEAARDLQKKLVATGALAGVIVVGATVASVGVPDLGVGAAPGAAPAPITRSVQSDIGIADASGAAIVDAALGSSDARGVADDVGIMDASGATGAGTAVGTVPSTEMPSVIDTGSSSVIGGAVHPGEVRNDLRTGSAAATGAGAGVADDVGIMDASGAAVAGSADATGAGVADDTGLMDASGAAITDAAAASATDEQIVTASQSAEAARAAAAAADDETPTGGGFRGR